MNLFNTSAIAEAAAGTTTNSGGDFISMIIMIVVMVAIFYFLLIRPQRKKDKQVKEMLNNLKKGDRICTIGGIYGTILNIKDDTITLAVGKDNLSMVIARWGVRSVEELTIENDNGELLN